MGLSILVIGIGGIEKWDYFLGLVMKRTAERWMALAVVNKTIERGSDRSYISINFNGYEDCILTEIARKFEANNQCWSDLSGSACQEQGILGRSKKLNHLNDWWEFGCAANHRLRCVATIQ